MIQGIKSMKRTDKTITIVCETETVSKDIEKQLNKAFNIPKWMQRRMVKETMK